MNPETVVTSTTTGPQQTTTPTSLADKARQLLPALQHQLSLQKANLQRNGLCRYHSGELLALEHRLDHLENIITLDLLAAAREESEVA
jgi:hypothetical protein